MKSLSFNNHAKQSRFLCLFSIIFILSSFLLPSISTAAGIIAVQSIDIKPYDDVLDGFKNACKCRVKSFVLSEMKKENIVENLYKEKPELILAIGINALNTITGIKDIPIVYTMILSPRSLLSDHENISGVSMHISPENQLSLIRKTLPDIKSVGLLYDPGRSSDFIKKAELAASSIGIKLLTKEVVKSSKVLKELKQIKSTIDAFWMLPDLTVVTAETVELIFLFSLENRLPVITFSEKYLEIGAIMSLDIDTNDIGKQAWEIAEKLLSGTDIKSILRSDARKADITINRKIAERLGVRIRE